MTEEASKARNSSEDELIDAFLRASRLLVALSARSLVESTLPVTFAQFRALLVISRGSASNQTELAEELDVAPSSVTRMVDRLEGAGLVQRTRAPGSTRGLALSVTESGAAVVEQVTANRRQQIAKVVHKMPTERVETLIEALEAFADAGGEPPLNGDKADPAPVAGVSQALER